MTRVIKPLYVNPNNFIIIMLTEYIRNNRMPNTGDIALGHYILFDKAFTRNLFHASSYTDKNIL